MTADGMGPATRARRFADHLAGLTTGVEEWSVDVPSTHPPLPDLTLFGYDDLPEPGMLTAVTYGASLARHEAWVDSTPELTISVTSTDPAWAFALGYLAEQLRGTAPFLWGDTIDFADRPSEASEMTAFLLHHPLTLEPQDYLDIDVGDALPVHLVACIPIHDVERRFVLEHGDAAFWALRWDPYDVRRPPAV